MVYIRISLHMYILNHPDQKTRTIYPLASSSFLKFKWQNPNFRTVELNSLQTASILKQLSILENNYLVDCFSLKIMMLFLLKIAAAAAKSVGMLIHPFPQAMIQLSMRKPTLLRRTLSSYS